MTADESMAAKEVLHLTAEQWSDRLGASARGSQDAKKELAPEQEAGLSQNEREFIRVFEGNIRAQQANVRKDIYGFKTSLAKIYNDSVLEDLQGLPDKLITRNVDSRSEHSEHLGILRRECRDRRHDLAEFKTQNKLARIAKPRADSMTLLLWVAGIVAVETALNATFFAAGSDRGLLGGAIQAFVISFINVYAAWIGGRHCFPKLNHIDSSKRNVGIVTCALVVGLIICLNLFAGHYRSALEQDPFSAVVQAVLTFIDNMLGISSAQGWLLSAVGVVAATGLCIKIYMSDDPYPGYGDMKQYAEEAEKNWVDAQQEFTSIIRNNYDMTEQERRDKTNRLTELELQFRRQMDLAHHVATDFEDFCHGEESKCNHVVNDYRMAFVNIRKDERKPIPVHFSESVSLHVEQYVMNVDLDEEHARFQKMVQDFERYRTEKSNDIKESLNEIHNQAVEELPEFFACV